MKNHKIHEILENVKINEKLIKSSETRQLQGVSEKGSKWGQNGSKWCFWAKGAKRPKKAKNREKRPKFGQKW